MQGRAGARRISHETRDPRHLRCDAAGHVDGYAISHAPRPTTCQRLDTTGKYAGSGDGKTECQDEGSPRGASLRGFSTAGRNIGDTAATAFCQEGLKAVS